MTATLGEKLCSVTLYERLGGAAGIRALVDGIVGAHLENPVIEARFRPYLDQPARVAEIKRHTCAFLSEGSGGPDTYRGRSMAEAHRGMGITDAGYAALWGLPGVVIGHAGSGRGASDHLGTAIGGSLPGVAWPSSVRARTSRRVSTKSDRLRDQARPFRQIRP